MSSERPTPLFLDLSKRTGFLLVCLVALLLLFVKKSFIEDETAAFEFLSGTPEGSILTLRSTLQYISIPLVYGWKILVLSFVVWVGCFSFGYRVTYSQCWQIVTAAEFAIFVPEVVKIVWFMAVETDPVFYRINAFYPLSAMGFFDYTQVPDRYHYPLKSLNLFELLYGYMLVTGIMHFTKKGFREAVTVVLMTYLPIFLLWLGFYMIVYK
ncbi:MAG: hypothetical protein ACO263_10430 [Cyclobacteriaceae bacterium]|jgi:hypothetical protein